MEPHGWRKALADRFYETSQTRSDYAREHPSETVLAFDAAKAVKFRQVDDEIQIRRGLHWVFAKRAVILLTEKRITCGRWDIPLAEIADARLVRMRTLFGRIQVLAVTTKDTTFQFGMELNPEWTRQQVLPLIVVQGKLKSSPFSLVIRLAILAYLVYWIIG